MKKRVWVVFLFPSSCTHTFPLQVFSFFLFLGFSRLALIRKQGGIFITLVNIVFVGLVVLVDKVFFNIYIFTSLVTT